MGPAVSCLECGKPAQQVTRMTREYCSDDCYTERKRRIRRERPQPICTICGNGFVRTSNRQKVCAGCREAKDRNYTTVYLTLNDDVIRPKRREGMRAFRAENAEVMRERNRVWRAANSEEINAKRRTPEYREKADQWRRERERRDHRYVVRNRIAAAIKQALRANKAGRKWEVLVGYTLGDLTRHLERQFSAGMGWHNLGQWHIDHIVPHSAFAYQSADDAEFKAAWALTNLRPLWAVENRAKHAKRTHLL